MTDTISGEEVSTVPYIWPDFIKNFRTENCYTELPSILGQKVFLYAEQSAVVHHSIEVYCRVGFGNTTTPLNIISGVEDNDNDFYLSIIKDIWMGIVKGSKDKFVEALVEHTTTDLGGWFFGIIEHNDYPGEEKTYTVELRPNPFEPAIREYSLTFKNDFSKKITSKTSGRMIFELWLEAAEDMITAALGGCNDY